MGDAGVAAAGVAQHLPGDVLAAGAQALGPQLTAGGEAVGAMRQGQVGIPCRCPVGS